MSLFQWPFKRKTYPGLDNPRFVDDILAANEAVLDGLMAICGLGPADFAIISGMDYTAGTPGTYLPGIFYLNGSFYVMTAGFSEGLYLAANPTDTMPQPFGDGNSRKIYTLLTGITQVGPAGASPVFAGNMNASRIGNKFLAGNLTTVLGTLNTLRGGAFADIGQVPGTVAAGNDPRFGYSVSDINTLFALKSTVLIMGSTNGNFVPSQPFDPATKSYVDSQSAKRLLSGNAAVGDVPAGGKLVTVAFGTTLSDTNYLVFGAVNSASGDPQIDVLYGVNIRNKTTASFDAYFREGGNNIENVSFDWIVFER